jgi:hypothetical protein
MRKQKTPGLLPARSDKSVFGRKPLQAGPTPVPQIRSGCRLAEFEPGRRHDEQQTRRCGGDEESLRDVHE